MDDSNATAIDCGSVNLQGVATVLARSPKLRGSLASLLGEELAHSAMSTLLEGVIVDEIFDILVDEIHNEATEVWSGYTFDENDPEDEEAHFPIKVMEYEGVYFVFALEYDDVGYFLTQAAAIDYICSEHMNVLE